MIYVIVYVEPTVNLYLLLYSYYDSYLFINEIKYYIIT